MTIHFTNPGLLPLEALTTLGVSVKETSDPIGRFGTGLKYTIAGILRRGEQISIEIGEDKYVFDVESRNVRGKVFDLVILEHLNTGARRELGFTTDLGPHWEPWMLIRELWSNMKDEGGWCGYDLGEFPEGHTRILVTGRELEEAFANRREFLLPENETPNWRTEYGDYYAGDGNTLYYQGIAVFRSDRPFLGRYNLRGYVELTEDRTLSEYAARGHISSIAAESDDVNFLSRYYTAGELFFESSIAPDTPQVGTPAYDTLKSLWERAPARLNPSSANLASRLFRPDRTAITFTPTPVEQAKFDRALAFLRKIGVDREVEWNFVDPEDGEAYGFVTDGKIYICRTAFTSGTQFLAQVMLEEYLHATHGYIDRSLRLQNWLFAKVISLGEEVVGEPL